MINSQKEWEDYTIYYKDVVLSGIDPQKHFEKIGSIIGRGKFPSNKNVFEESLVSIIIVNFNGRHHLDDLFDSLKGQSYKNYEIIFIDNNSTDQSVTFTKNQLPEATVIQLRENIGFADACNVGQELARGEYLALLNNDTIVDRDWLRELVKVIKASPSVGAVCSKVLFYKRFFPFNLRTNNKEILIKVDLLYTTNAFYKKAFFNNTHPKEEFENEVYFECTEFDARLPRPEVGSSQIPVLELYNPHDHPVEVTIDTNRKREISILPRQKYHLELIDCDYADSKFIINNAGSEFFNENQSVRDIGIYEEDLGQYEGLRLISAFCGCAVLINRRALQGSSLFCGKFFAYYEDTELSARLTKNKFKIYCHSKSIVFHKHASTSAENSPMFRFLLTRNHLYYHILHLHDSVWQKSLEETKQHLNHLEHYYRTNISTVEEREFVDLIPQILSDLDEFHQYRHHPNLYKTMNQIPRIAVYNTWWDTRGGGEHHALNVANLLSQGAVVDLISENDFNISGLTGGFDMKFYGNFRKRIIEQVTEDITKEYDVFVNSSFTSSLVSRARKSFYIISFPHTIDPENSHYRQFIDSYTFLANSKYTAEWTEKFWRIKPLVLYPSVNVSATRNSVIRKNVILHVGRFFQGGHNKKQYELAKAFTQLKRSYGIARDWKLVLAGRSDQPGLEIVQRIRDEFSLDSVEVYNDVSHEDLHEFYCTSSFYWHATGLNEDPERDPDRFEHFGMTTIEAMSHGLIPIVYRSGGQTEIITHEYDGYLFDTCQELIQITAQCLKMHDQDNPLIEEMRARAIHRSHDFSIDIFNQNCLERMGVSAQYK
jgi:GT2 family glycosyltransferase